MKKVIVIVSAIFIFNYTILFSLDCYSYDYSNDITYAIAISPSNIYEEEYIVGLIEIDPVGNERWTISTQTVIDEDKTFKSKTDVNFPTIKIKENYIDIEINIKNNVILHLNKVDTIIYKNCVVIIPEVFYR